MKAPLYSGKNWLGALSEIQQTPLELYPRLHQALGPVVRIKLLPGMEMYSVAHPDAMGHVLRSHQQNYPKPKVFLDAVKPLTGNGLFTNMGANWHTQRKLMAPGFHHRQIARMLGVMVEETERTAQRWRDSPDQIRDMAEEMMTLTLNIVSRTLFSTDVMGRAGAISEAVRDAFAYTGYRLNNPLSLGELLTGKRRRAFRKAKALLDHTLNQMIEDRLKTGDPGNDMLGLLLMARDEETGQGMDAKQLTDELLTLMIAGHETTAAALAWAWYLLARNPGPANQLYQSVQNFVGPEIQELPRFAIPPYAQWVFEETMRLYPPAWGVPREATEADEIMGFEIRPKTVINCSFFAMFRDPQFWPDPLNFQPERFSETVGEDRPKYAFIPFGLGKRQCIGLNMAMVEGPLILSLLAREFQPSLIAPDEEVTMDATFALRPSGKLAMKMNPRNH